MKYIFITSQLIIILQLLNFTISSKYSETIFFPVFFLQFCEVLQFLFLINLVNLLALNYLLDITHNPPMLLVILLDFPPLQLHHFKHMSLLLLYHTHFFFNFILILQPFKVKQVNLLLYSARSDIAFYFSFLFLQFLCSQNQFFRIESLLVYIFCFQQALDKSSTQKFIYLFDIILFKTDL